MPTNKPATKRLRPTRGTTLIEALCVISIVGTSVGLAAPSLSGWRDQHALQGATAQLETDIQYARSQAVSLNTTVRLTTRVDAGGSCYVVHTGAAGSCTCNSSDGAVCTGNEPVWRAVAFPANTPVQLVSRNTSIAFDPERGTVTPTATFKLSAGHGKTLHQVVNIMGRVRTCSPDNMTGHRAC